MDDQLNTQPNQPSIAPLSFSSLTGIQVPTPPVSPQVSLDALAPMPAQPVQSAPGMTYFSEPVAAAPIESLENLTAPDPAPVLDPLPTNVNPNVPEVVREEREPVSYADATIQEIELAKIVPNPFQPRKVFKPEALQELAASIREHGVVQPLVVTETPVGYEIVVGERRFRASQLAGLTKVPAIVKKSLQDQTKLEVALIENIQRQELNPIEEAQAYDRLMKTFNLTQDEVAKKVGKSRPAIANTVRLLNLPAEVQRGLVEGRVTEGHTRPLIALRDPDRIIAVYHTILEQGWSARTVEQKIREMVQPRNVDGAMPDPKFMAIETELRGKLGAQVKIQRQGRGGKIMIEFFSDEELNDILDRMHEAENATSGHDGFITV
jgi:ParB family chromosome partitioning protein